MQVPELVRHAPKRHIPPATLTLAAVMLSACIPHLVSVPSEQFAENRSSYATQAFTVQAPPGRWVTDSIFVARGLTGNRCEYPFAPQFAKLTRDMVASVTFHNVMRIGWTVDDGRTDTSGCVRIAVFTVAESFKEDSESAIRHWIEPVLNSMTHFDEKAYLQPVVTNDRTVYAIRFVDAKGKSADSYHMGRHVFFVNEGRLFLIYFSKSNVKPADAAWTVISSIQPLKP